MINNIATIGIFDSGFGGLSVLNSIYRQMPYENYIYIADSRYTPYGEKDNDFIIDRSIKITNFFIKKRVKAMVIACNTATAAAVKFLREQNPSLPIIAMEPAIKPAKEITRTKKVGVLATSSTIKSPRFMALVDRFAQEIEIYPQPCPGLAECIEKGELTHEHTKTLLKKYLSPLLTAGCDTIILGCTHYPFLRTLFTELLPPSIHIIDSGEGVAKHLQNVLLKSQKQIIAHHIPSTIMYTTGDLEPFKNTLKKLWSHDITAIQQVDI